MSESAAISTASGTASPGVAAVGAILAKLPTWPWSMGTLRGFASAIQLPITLLQVQQAVSRLF